MTVSVRPARFSLGAYLAFAFSLLSILLTVILTVMIERTASAQVRSSIGANLAELANQTTSRLDRSLFERYREVELMASRLSRGQALEDVQRELDSMQASYPFYAWIGLTDPAGTVMAATRGLLKGVDVSDRPWFANVRNGQNLGDVQEARMLSKLMDNPGTEPLRFVDLAFAVPNGAGQSTGVLGAHLSWAWAQDVRQVIFMPLGRSRTVEPLIVSNDGTVLLGPTELEGTQLALASVKAAAAGESGFRIEPWADGRRYLVGFSKSKGYRSSPGLGWTVLVRQDLAEAEVPVRQLQLRLLVWGAGMALLFSVLGWLTARGVIRPLRNLVRTAQALESGSPSPAISSDNYSFSYSYKEVQELGDSFRLLVVSLQHKEDDLRALNVSLEQRVEERTAELREAFARVQESEQRIHTIIEAAQDSFIGMDFQGRITDWNSQAERLFGWRREEVLGRPLADTLLPARFAGTSRAALEVFMESGDAPFVGHPMERVMVTRDGRELSVEVKIGLVNTGKLRLFSAFVQDISQRKQAERLKNEFISTVSHELRTPMTAIYASLSLLEAGMTGELPDDARKLIAISCASCERLIRLVNDVLDVEKIDAGLMQYAKQPQRLRALVEQASSDTEAVADRQGVDFRIEASADPMVCVDADRIVQVLVNLLSNAVKFSVPGGTVDIRVSVQDGMARVGVVDRGAGVPAHFRSRVFERFAQADGSDSRQKGGSGLGLNICRSIVQAHGGRIDFTSEPGCTEFSFDVPLA